ncbi:MAG: glycosyltransferase family 2 protein [Capsulimonadales bacterium]|nr:glycosyltransferase family 2 protein [Capsulimonadales bacterium]
MTISVLVPTYRRPNDLRLVLDTLKRQDRFPDQVIVTVRDTDTETQAFFRGYDADPLPLTVTEVREPGVVAAMNAGLAVVTGDITVLTDDDTEPFPDWLKRIEAHFVADPTVGGVGGRDHQKIHPGPETEDVGRLSWFGRLTGNHHVGIGPPREVDTLKGANCAYRTVPLRAIGFDTRLLGSGAQVNWELGLGLALRRAGWKLIYDPQVAVHHHIAQRFGDDQTHRGIFQARPYQEAVHNETLFLWYYLSPPQRMAFTVWSVLVGTRGVPGVVQLIRFPKNPEIRQRFLASFGGRLSGVRAARTTRPPGSPPPRPDEMQNASRSDTMTVRTP